MRLLTALLGTLAVGCAEIPTSPEPSAEAVALAEAAEIAELEKAFWHCDYVATKRGVLATPIAPCQHATAELKRRKFGGRFSALVAWWRENKAIEHRRVEHARGGESL